MPRVCCAMLVLCLCLLPAAAAADTFLGRLAGTAADGTALAADIEISFFSGGGDFASGQGSGSFRVTVRNRSGLVPFQSPAWGNPVITTLYFNVPPGARLALAGATIPAGGVIFRSGVSRNPVPGGAARLASALDASPYYELLAGPSAGRFGRFTHALSTNRGIIGGVVDSGLFVGTTRLGDIFAPLVFAGDIVFTLTAGGLDRRLDSARELLATCSSGRGSSVSAAAAFKAQGFGVGGQGSDRVGEPCDATPATSSTWGGLKRRYR